MGVSAVGNGVGLDVSGLLLGTSVGDSVVGK